MWRPRGARRFDLQRLFSSFPSGAAGLGLLLLRAAVGGALVAEGALVAGQGLPDAWSAAFSAVSILCGGALLFGVLTPAAGALAAALALVRVVAPPALAGYGLEGGAAHGLLLVMAAAAPPARTEGYHAGSIQPEEASMPRIEGACSHIEGVESVAQPKQRECEECVKIGGEWIHLRTCQSCGGTRCCDSSPNRHASRHAKSAHHPVIASAEPGEHWLYCFVDEVGVEY